MKSHLPEKMTNASMRKRFGLPDSSYTSVSKIIKDTLSEELIKSFEQGSASRRDAKYIPFWT